MKENNVLILKTQTSTDKVSALRVIKPKTIVFLTTRVCVRDFQFPMSAVSRHTNSVRNALLGIVKLCSPRFGYQVKTL